MRFLALAAAFCSCALGAEIHGSVVSAVTGRPLVRAEVILRSAVAGGPTLGATTDENGRFAFFDVAAGEYLMGANRSGYLPSNAVYQNQARMLSPFPLRANLDGIIVRLSPGATISGKVRHDDGEVAPGVGVQAYREVFQRKRHFYEVVARTVTDDRGEYRLFGLPKGRYYVAAVHAPYGGSADVVEQPVRDAHGQLVLPERTVTTFAPSTFKLSEASPVTVVSGETAGTTDIFFAKTRVALVRGRVLSEQGGIL